MNNKNIERISFAFQEELQNLITGSIVTNKRNLNLAHGRGITSSRSNPLTK